MTEAEWLAAGEPFTMADFAKDSLTTRKLRLFCCACSSSYLRTIDDPSLATAAALLERHADGELDESEELRPNTFLHNSLVCEMWGRRPYLGALRSAGMMSSDVSRQFNHGPHRKLILREESQKQSAYLRDILGNPFRPVIFKPEWRTTSVVSVAKSMYENRNFTAMPVLADALQDAACENEDLLNHCRSDGPHVKGCWVVDLTLSKE